ncbi:MAG: hypothetical protein PHE84_00970 [bacterium]|nr:hypothetical protein [bacterium]
MKLTGDPRGLEDLREIKEKKVEYLKFLITSAKTNFDRKMEFKSIDNQRSYFLVFDPVTLEFRVEGKAG